MTREEIYLVFMNLKYPDWEFAFVESEDVERRKSDGWSMAENLTICDEPKANEGLSG